MRRRTLLLATLLIPAGLVAASAKDQVFDLFAKIAEALSADDPLVFLHAIDHDMPHYDDFQVNLTALASQAEITNSIEVLSDQGDDEHRAEELDWYIQLVDKGDATVTRRREVVHCRLERRAKKWKIVAIEPFSLFAPLKETKR